MNGQKHTLVILNPGHFHAALTLRERHALIDDDIHVFAQEGPDVDQFVRLVHAFNDRAIDPTRWTLYVYRGPDFLEKLLERRPGKTVIVAGRNNEKLPLMHLLHGQGFSVLGDKPWLIDSAQLPLLKEITASAPLAMDVMTERHEIANRLLKTLAGLPSVFGKFRVANQPSIAMRSVHHLCKSVNNQPLQRPAWYFDPDVQGDGITDVTTHLVDLAQWMTDDGSNFDFTRDVEGLSARQWPTIVPLDLFVRITGLESFPAFLHDRVANGQLHYLCNASLRFRLRGVPVEIETLWGLEEAQGGGDLQHTILRGTKADLIVDQGPETQFMTTVRVDPVEKDRHYAQALTDALSSLQDGFPGIGVEAAGEAFSITIPSTLRTSHEEHFSDVLQVFLGYLDEGGFPEHIGSQLNMKYSLLAQALDLSRKRSDLPGVPGANTPR